MKWNQNKGTYGLNELVRMYKGGRIVINKEYQRGFVWSQRFQRDLIISLLKGLPVSSIILRQRDDDSGIAEVVDGQQRIQTIVNFMSPENEKERLLLNGTHSKIAVKIMKYDQKISSFEDLTEFDKIDFGAKVSIAFETIVGTDEEVKEYFNLIQQQEEVKAGEIISNLPFEIFDTLAQDFEDSKKVLENLGFNNKRGDFLKILIANFGIKNNIFHLGATNDEVIKFSKDLNQAFKNNETFKGFNKENFLSDMKHSFMFLNRIENKIDVGKGKRRFLRLFLIISNYLKSNSYLNIDFLSIINRELSVINDKETLINLEKKKEFINSLINMKMITQHDEFDYFVKLSNLFSKTKKLSDDHYKVIKFWLEKVANTD